MCVCVWHYLASVNKQKFCILNGLSELEEDEAEAEAEKSLADCGETKEISLGVAMGTVISLPLLHDNAETNRE